MTVNRGIYRGVLPKITWGAAFANTIVFARPLDDPVSWPEPVDASATPCKNGEEDGWTHGDRWFLSGRVRRVPRVDTAGVTGWEGATGWDAFLAWARDEQAARFYPDAAGGTFFLVYVLQPEAGHEEEISRHRQFELVLQSADNAEIAGY